MLNSVLNLVHLLDIFGSCLVANTSSAVNDTLSYLSICMGTRGFDFAVIDFKLAYLVVYIVVNLYYSCA